MNTRKFPPMSEAWPARNAVNLTAIFNPIVYKIWEHQHLTIFRSHGQLAFSSFKGNKNQAFGFVSEVTQLLICYENLR
jgi:hypothetical protein